MSYHAQSGTPQSLITVNDPFALDADNGPSDFGAGNRAVGLVEIQDVAPKFV